MASRREEQKEDARFRIMRLLDEEPTLSTRQIANRIGVSNGSVHYILNALMEKGFLKLDNFRKNPRKDQYTYLLTSAGVREKSMLTQRFIQRKRKEYKALKAEIEQLEREVIASDNSLPIQEK